MRGYCGGTYVVAVQLLLLVQLRVHLVDTWTEVGWVTTESNVEVLQELVAASKEGLWCVSTRLNTWLTIKDNDTVSKVSGHDEIVLDNEGGLLGVHDETLDDTGSNNTLLGIEVSGRLVNEVDISWDTKGENDGNTLQFSSGQVLDLLVNEIIELQWLDDISLELWRQELGLDLLEEELADGSIELWSDRLWLHGDLHLWHLAGSIWLDSTGQHLTESGLSGSVLSHHDDNLGISEVSLLNVEVEIAKSLLHRWVAEGTGSVGQKLITSLSNAESEGFLTETQVFSWNVTIQEDVDTLTNGCWHSNNTINSWASVKNANEVGQIIEDGQIVLDDDNVVVWAEEGADDGGSLKTLLDIEVGGRLVEHVDIGLLDTDGSDGETLEFSAREEGNITVHDVVQLKGVANLLKVVHLGSALNESLDGLVSCTDSSWNLVDILRLDNGLQVILEELGEVVCSTVRTYTQSRCFCSTHSEAQNHGSA